MIAKYQQSLGHVLTVNVNVVCAETPYYDVGGVLNFLRAVGRPLSLKLVQRCEGWDGPDGR